MNLSANLMFDRYASGWARKATFWFKSEKTLKMAIDFFNLIHNS
jgi:hypothetical protein